MAALACRSRRTRTSSTRRPTSCRSRPGSAQSCPSKMPHGEADRGVCLPATSPQNDLNLQERLDMRLSNVAGPCAPLLVICAAVAIGCATGTAQQPVSGPPQVVAVYSIDTLLFTGSTSTQNGPRTPLPDVLLFHQTDTRVSDKAPASYDGLRVEFSQPLDASTVVTPNPPIGGAASSVANASFCVPLTGDPTSNPVQVLDVSGANGGAANNVIPASVCYNPASDLGSNPSVIVQLGATTLSSTAVAFTCNTFSRPAVPAGSATTGNSNFASYVLNKPYALKLATTIKGSNGQGLAAPSGGNPSGKWAGTTFTYQSSGFEILAAGFQDANTGVFTWLNKASPGFMKDLDAVSASSYKQPADNTPFLIVTTLRPGSVGSIAVTRKANGSTFGTFNFASGSGDRRQINIIPGEDGDANWEPGVEYVVNVPGTLKSRDGTLTLGTG